MAILCITPNPALDRILLVPGFAAGGVWRARATRAVAGGKGLNVARAVLSLGEPVRALAPLGGLAGATLARLAREDGLGLEALTIAGETRISTIVLDGAGGASVVNEPGPEVGAEEWARLIAAARDLATGSEAVAISGSLPSGVAPQDLLALARAVASPDGTPTWIDTSGAALAALLDADHADRARLALKVNHLEAASALGPPIKGGAEAGALARRLVESGFAAVAITLGPAGAVLATPAGLWSAEPPVVAAVNPVGSGDAFLAGLLAAWVQGPAAALRLASACGAANAAGQGAGHVEKASVAALAARVVVAPIDD